MLQLHRAIAEVAPAGDIQLGGAIVVAAQPVVVRGEPGAAWVYPRLLLRVAAGRALELVRMTDARDLTVAEPLGG